jgi:hypothetical protein
MRGENFNCRATGRLVDWDWVKGKRKKASA